MLRNFVESIIRNSDYVRSSFQANGGNAVLDMFVDDENLLQITSSGRDRSSFIDEKCNSLSTGNK